MAGIDAQMKIAGSFGRFAIRYYRLRFVVRVITGIRFSIEFDPVRPHPEGALHHPHLGIDKNGNPDVLQFYFAHYFLEQALVLYGVPTCIGGRYVRSVGNECGLSRFYFPYDFQVAVIRVDFYIKFGGDTVFQLLYIVIANVSFVGPGVNGDALCTKAFAIFGYLDHIRIIAAPGVTEGSNFVNIYT